MANALSPAQVLTVRTNDETNTASVIVPDRQLSLAIGKEGQNARLAAKLTGWRIDIKPESAMQEVLAATPATPAPAKATARPKAPAAAAASRDEAAEPWMEVVETGEAAAAEAAEEAAPVAVAAPAETPVAEPAETGPRIRFAEELAPARQAAPKKVKKGAKAPEEPEGKAKKGPTKKARPLVEDDDADLALDFGWDKDKDDKDSE